MVKWSYAMGFNRQPDNANSMRSRALRASRPPLSRFQQRVPAEPLDGPLILGDWVELKNGESPVMLVVDAWPRSHLVTVAYRIGGKVSEWELPSDEIRCIKRASR